MSIYAAGHPNNPYPGKGQPKSAALTKEGVRYVGSPEQEKQRSRLVKQYPSMVKEIDRDLAKQRKAHK